MYYYRMYFVTVFLNRQWSQQRMSCLTFLWRELTLWVSQPPLGRLWRPLLTLGVSQFQPRWAGTGGQQGAGFILQHSSVASAEEDRH